MTDLKSFDEPSLRRDAGIAIWKQLEIQLAQEIGKGVFGKESRLPTEATLANRFGVNRHTVRRAVAALSERGLVRVEHGRGMFVQDVVIDYPLTRRTSFSANLLGQGKAPTSHMLSLTVIDADQQVAAALSLSEGTPVLRRQAVGFADDVPISAGMTYFPQERFPGLAGELEKSMSISKALKACGLAVFHRLSTQIITRLPTNSEASALRQPESQPVLITEAVDGDREKRPISFGMTCFAGARVQITVEPD